MSYYDQAYEGHLHVIYHRRVLAKMTTLGIIFLKMELWNEFIQKKIEIINIVTKRKAIGTINTTVLFSMVFPFCL